MLFKKLALFVICLLLSGCGFHFKNDDIQINFSKIEPKAERDKYIHTANSLGIHHNEQSNYVITNLKIEPKLMSNKNTGNKWRQYDYTASWTLHYKNNNEIISANESINIPSSQSPYQKQIISDQLNGLRVQLLKNTITFIYVSSE